MMWALKHWMCSSWFFFKSGQKLEHIVLGIVLLCKSSTYRFKVSSLLCWQLDFVMLQIWESRGCIFISFFFSFRHHLLHFTIHKFTIRTDHLSHQPYCFYSYKTEFPICRTVILFENIVRKQNIIRSLVMSLLAFDLFFGQPCSLHLQSVIFSLDFMFGQVSSFFLICNMAAGMSKHMGALLSDIWSKNTNKVNFLLPWLSTCWLFHKVTQISFCRKIMLVKWDYYSAVIVPISQFYCTNHLCVGRDALCCDLGLIWLMTKWNK